MGSVSALTAGPGVDLRAVVFDFDGTLVDSNEIKRLAYDQAFGDIAGATAAIRRTLERPPAGDRRAVIAAIVGVLRYPPRGGRRALIDRLVRRYSRICRIEVGRARDFPGVAATLRRLAGTYTLAINSATPQRPLRALVARREWPIRPELVLGAPASKVENLARLARRLRLRPQQIVLVGDSKDDARAAERFGCHFVLVSLDQRSAVNRNRAIRHFRSLPAELAALSRRLRNDPHD